ncbi:hypothetical protein [Bacillus andreraoultii]|uniref:hypothetical protein n=1 Tax=Bacillus andreraoultii TaxID=1499685 RepID=UPI00053BB09F|nr:hypothetical protein [Bacillus andreraoultii]
MTEQQCPECGSTELGVAKWSGMANLQPVGKLNLKGGSPVLATLCTECGYILSIKVKEPHIFKK